MLALAGEKLGAGISSFLYVYFRTKVPFSAMHRALFLVSSPCNVSNGGCSHMCLRGNNQVYKCACPDDMNIDSVNSKLCVYKTTTKTGKM